MSDRKKHGANGMATEMQLYQTVKLSKYRNLQEIKWDVFSTNAGLFYPRQLVDTVYIAKFCRRITEMIASGCLVKFETGETLRWTIGMTPQRMVLFT